MLHIVRVKLWLNFSANHTQQWETVHFNAAWRSLFSTETSLLVKKLLCQYVFVLLILFKHFKQYILLMHYLALLMAFLTL